jgi:hypothetical protein
MFRFPYLGFPYGYPYYNYSNKYYYNKNIEKKEEKTSIATPDDSRLKEACPELEEIGFNKDEAVAKHLAEIFGIKLFLDDLIILGILFFLYKEEVKDDMLYIILFLLLFA